MKFCLCLASCLLAVSPALAQPAPQPKTLAPGNTAATVGDDFDKEVDALFVQGGLTADQAAARAAKVSPDVIKSAAEVDAAIAQRQTAQLSLVPQITGNASYTRLSPVDPLSFGGFNIEFPANSTVFSGTIGVPLSEYVWRLPKLISAAKLGEAAARTNQRTSEVNASHEARLAYFEWLRARLQVLIAQRQLAQVQTTLKQVRALAEVQRLSKADLMRVESEEASAEQTLNQLKNLFALREEQLRILIGAPQDEQLAISEDVRGDIAPPAQASVDDLLKHAEKNRLEFKAIDRGIEAKLEQREAERASLVPRLSAFAQADYANPNQRIFPQEDKFAFTWQAGVQLSWTINDTLITRKTLDRLGAEANQLRADRENLVRGTRVQVMSAQQDVDLAQLSLNTSQKALASAMESYRVRKELLNAERATAVELVDAETTLTRARIAALNARVDLRVALANLSHALGDDVNAAK
jgi:outer membrane protein TolC